MKSQIIKIGNSQGLRIPKNILDHCELAGEVELEVRNQELVIRSAHRPRQGWEKAFKNMSDNEDDKLFDESFSTKFDRSEWKW